MGVVYLAEDLSLGRKVALKLLAPDLAQDARFRERFVRESRLAASLEHPNIIPIFEAKEARGHLYIAMRLVGGTDLKSLIQQEGSLDLGRTVSILSQVASALDAAHAEGLIHRDVKPANILIARAGPGATEHVYLSDFGLTKRATSDSGITATGQFVGTLDYAAPEQFEGKPLTAATDVYSLGCVLFECLTGEVPFPREQEAALMYAHLLSAPPSVTDKAGSPSPRLDHVIARALAKAPEERFATCGELMKAAGAESGEADVSVAPLPPVPSERPPHGGFKRRRVWLGGAVAALVMVVVIAVVLSAGRSSTHKVGEPGASSAVPGSALGIESTSDRTRLKARIGKSADAVAVGRGSVWVADRTDNVVVRLDETTGREQARISIAGGPRGVAVDDSVPGVWVMTGLSVWGIDPVTNEVNKTIPLQAHATDIAVGEGAVWVSVTRLNEGLVRVDPATGATRNIASLSGNLGGAGLAVGGGAVWVIGPSSPAIASVVKIDASTTEVEEPILLRTPAAAITFGDGAVWVLAPNGALSRIDPRTDQAEVVVDSGSGVSGLAAGKGSVWVTAGHTLIRVDAQAGKVTVTIDLKARVTAVAVGAQAVWATTEPS
jgi:serine/threonine protein kinase